MSASGVSAWARAKSITPVALGGVPPSDDVVVSEVTVDDNTLAGQLPGVVKIAGKLARELADDGGPVRADASCVKLLRQQDPGHVGQRERARALAGHLDLADGGMVARQQGADLLHRRPGCPAHRLTGQEGDDLPQNAICP